ncbi:unnamed protein product [Prunus armeniaca]|uniref:Uncharacterized protein n=1 Tax=Prunus armeniaca TaxID=36596 RepID=A0A6J5X431_PRUAR|nr:unnamed protein product [Prunus armeniaca]
MLFIRVFNKRAGGLLVVLKLKYKGVPCQYKTKRYRRGFAERSWGHKKEGIKSLGEEQSTRKCGKCGATGHYCKTYKNRITLHINSESLKPAQNIFKQCT